MPKPIKNLTNMEFDEISLVDKGANQHAMVVIAKRAPEEDDMPEFDLYREDGSSVTEESLSEGDIVYDGEGNAYKYSEKTEDEVEVKDEEKVAEPVGKSAFLEKRSEQEADFTKQVMDELSKAFTDDDRDKVIAKALGRVGQVEKALAEQSKIAKSERDLRLTREYISKAAEYNLPVDSAELGPVLYRMAEAMSYEDCAVIAKCLDATSDMLFEEVGYIGGGDNGDVYDEVVAKAAEISKSDTPSLEALNGVFNDNPAAYDEYLSAQRGR